MSDALRTSIRNDKKRSKMLRKRVICKRGAQRGAWPVCTCPLQECAAELPETAVEQRIRVAKAARKRWANKT